MNNCLLLILFWISVSHSVLDSFMWIATPVTLYFSIYAFSLACTLNSDHLDIISQPPPTGISNLTSKCIRLFISICCFSVNGIFYHIAEPEVQMLCSTQLPHSWIQSYLSAKSLSSPASFLYLCCPHPSFGLQPGHFPRRKCHTCILVYTYGEKGILFNITSYLWANQC